MENPVVARGIKESQVDEIIKERENLRAELLRDDVKPKGVAILTDDVELNALFSRPEEDDS